MAKAFSVASWNVEHFGALDKQRRKPKKPIAPIIDQLAAQDADVVALYEVRSSLVFRPLVEALPGYQFHITEGPQAQEILVGVRSGFSSFVTQKLEFKASQPGLRPGVLLTLRIDGAYYPVIFLHLKSMTDPKGFGLRDAMLRLALAFRKRLDEADGGGGQANYLFVGDLNTMGMDYPYAQHDITAQAEIAELDRRARHHTKRMRVLEKNAPFTWWGDRPQGMGRATWITWWPPSICSSRTLPAPRWMSGAGPRSPTMRPRTPGRIGSPITPCCTSRCRRYKAYTKGEINFVQQAVAQIAKMPLQKGDNSLFALRGAEIGRECSEI